MRNQTRKFINNKPGESFRNSPFAHASVTAAPGPFNFFKYAVTEKNGNESARRK